MARTKNRHTLLKLFLLLVLVAVIGFGGWLGLSAKKVSGLFDQAMSSYESIRTNVEGEDYAAALTAARDAANYTSQAAAELEGLQWDIASHLPVVGADVGTLRSIGSISGDLADDAVLPVLDSWDRLTSDGIVNDGTVDLSKFSEKFNQFVELTATFQAADKVVDDCATRADALPTSHFSMVNEWTGQLREAVSSADAIFDEFGGIVDLVANVTSTISSLTGGGATDTTTPTMT